MNKSYRQGQILKLIASTPVFTQEELADQLRNLYGIETTQVTLSRDIRDLGLLKTAGGYRQVVAAPGSRREFATVAEEYLWDVRSAQNLVVLKTSPANASSVAAALDHQSWPEVVGTIAGDDTVLVITPDSGSASLLQNKLLTYVSRRATAANVHR